MLGLRHAILQEPNLWVLGETVLSLLWVTGIGSFQTPHCPSLSHGFWPDLSPVGITVDVCQMSYGWCQGCPEQSCFSVSVEPILGMVQIGQPLPPGLGEACLAVPVLWKVAWLCRCLLCSLLM